MNEKLKELAVQAGVLFDIDPTYTYGASPAVLERFAELVLQNYVSQIMTTEDRERFIRDDEREACAALCEEASLYFIDDQASASYAANYCAEEIRKRENHE
jgi:hypothetical protein